MLQTSTVTLLIGIVDLVLWLGSLLNLLVVVLIMAVRDLRTAGNVQIGNICIACFLYALELPLVAEVNIRGNWIHGEAACKFMLGVEYVGKCGSIFFVMCASIERFLYICKSRKMDMRATLLVSLVSWIMLFSTMTPIFYYAKVIPLDDIYDVNNTSANETKKQCHLVAPPDFRQTFSIACFLTLFVAPTMIIVWCYSKIILTIHQRQAARNAHAMPLIELSQREPSTPSLSTRESSRKTRNISRITREGSRISLKPPLHYGALKEQHTSRSTSTANGYLIPSPSPTPRRSTSPCNFQRRSSQSAHIVYKKALKMVTSILVCYFFCWSPFWCLNFLIVTGLLNNDYLIVLILVHMLPYLFCALTPLLYGFMTENFNHAIRNVRHDFRSRANSVSMSLGSRLSLKR